MIQIPDAPWIREAEMFGYPVDEDDDECGDLDCGSCPMIDL